MFEGLNRSGKQRPDPGHPWPPALAAFARVPPLWEKGAGLWVANIRAIMLGKVWPGQCHLVICLVDSLTQHFMQGFKHMFLFKNAIEEFFFFIG